MQYWKPEGEEEFAGDMMPFWDGARFHLFYLLDRGHHAEQEGLGGHQWAHASTADLVEWEHHPLAVPIGAPGSYDQHGICTGGIWEGNGVYQAFYATRIRRPDGGVSEMICRADSRDLIHFDKSAENPLFGAPEGLEARNHRDPFVFRHPDTGEFHMLVTASRESQGASDAGGERGVLAHYTSPDGEQWQFQGPFLPLDKDPCPECPEHFFWNGWWYLVYSQSAGLQYWVSRDPLGPWQRARRDGIEPGHNLSVPRTAAFTGGRRLAIGFLPWRREGRDDADGVYAGNMIFRELIQDADGTLATRFVPEMMPMTGPPIYEQALLEVGADGGAVQIPDVPPDGVIRLRIVPEAGVEEYGLLLRSDARGETGYRLALTPGEGRMTLGAWPAGNRKPGALDGLQGLDQPVEIVVCLKDSLVDVCLNDRHTLVERAFDHRGAYLGFWARGGAIRIENLSISPLV